MLGDKKYIYTYNGKPMIFKGKPVTFDTTRLWDFRPNVELPPLEWRYQHVEMPPLEWRYLPSEDELSITKKDITLWIKPPKDTADNEDENLSAVDESLNDFLDTFVVKDGG